MKNKILLLILVAACFVSLHAETISQKQALQMAQLFFNEANGRVTAPPKLIYNGKRLTTDRLFTPFYVYNSPKGGFVIISADNKAFPILGFSLKDNLDPEDIGKTEQALLKSYAKEIELIRYNSEPIESTINSWQNYGNYIHDILQSVYVATDPMISIQESEQLIDNAVRKDEAIYSDLYTPEQWREMINDELNLKSFAPLAIYYDDTMFPAVVYGRQGDYYRIEMTKRNNWLMRLNATEIIESNMISVVVNPLELQNELIEDRPFEDIDSFIAEAATLEEGRRRVASVNINSLTEKPLIKANGGGHFDILLPENVVMARVYNLSGSMVRRYTYKNNDVASIDLSAEPSGFYFVTLIGETGTPYGFKLYR